jgi:hypothetical protein
VAYAPVRYRFEPGCARRRAKLGCPEQAENQAENIVSSFRLIRIAALASPALIFITEVALAQSMAAVDQSGKPYLAGLKPPHMHHSPGHLKTSQASAEHTATTKVAQPTKKHRPIVTADATGHDSAVHGSAAHGSADHGSTAHGSAAHGSTAHGSTAHGSAAHGSAAHGSAAHGSAAHGSAAHGRKHLADTINSRVSWPSVEPAAPEERTVPQTALQFVTEDTDSKAAAPTRPTSNVTPPTTAAKAPAINESRTVDPSISVDSLTNATPSTASRLVQTERIEAPDVPVAPGPSQMPVVAPASDQAPVTAPHNDQAPARAGSSTAQMAATLAGAIAACIVAFVMFGFGARTIRANRI